MSGDNLESVATRIWIWLKGTSTYKFKIRPLIRSTRALAKRIATVERADADEASAQHYDKPEVSTNSWDASKQVMELRIEADEQLAVISQCLSNVQKVRQYELKGNDLQSFLDLFKEPLGFETAITSDQLEESDELNDLEKMLNERYKKWQRVQEIIRRVKIRVLVCHAIFRISEKSRLELGSLILGGLVVLGAVHMYFFFQAAAGQVVHTYWTLDDIIIQGITTAWVAVGVLILYEGALQLLLMRYERSESKVVAETQDAEKERVEEHGHEAYRSNFLKAALRHPNVILCSFVIVLLVSSSGLGYVRGSEAFNDFLEAARSESPEDTELELAVMVGGKTLSSVHLVGTTSRTAVFLQKVAVEQGETEEDGGEEDGSDFVAPPSYFSISGEVGGALVDVVIPDFVQYFVQSLTRYIYSRAVIIFRRVFHVTVSDEENEVTRVDIPYQVVVVDRQQVLCHTKGRACASLSDGQTMESDEESHVETEVRDWIPTDYYFARFPIMFNKAKLDESLAAEQDEEVSQLPFVDGVEYVADDNGHIVEKLIESLAPCTHSLSNSMVTLRVEGYSSSAPFTYRDNVPLSESVSRVLNVRVANERRRNIEEEIQDEIRRQSLNGIVLEIGDDYDNLEQMKYSREFNDRPDEDEQLNGDFYQDLFTRAAHIKLMELGRCSVL